MACAAGVIGGNAWISLKNKSKKRNNINNPIRVSCSYAPSVMDPYKTLMIQPDASESEVKKAFRRLALQYHPDVCRGNNCGVQFHQINEAYDVAMSNLRDEPEESNIYQMSYEPSDLGIDEPMRGMNEDWDMWEEWMGWEGAGIRDYTSHINPYI